MQATGDSPAPIIAPLPDYAAQWTTLELPPPLVPVFDGVPAVRHDMLAIVGGFGKDLRTTPIIQLLHPTRGWLPVGSQMREARAGHTMTELGDGRVLIAGGVQGTLGGELTHVLSCEVLDPLRAGSEFAPPIDEPLVGHTAHALGDGRAAIICNASVRIFDANTMSWSTRISIAHPRRGHASVLLEDGSIVIIGGDEHGTIETIHPDQADGATSVTFSLERVDARVEDDSLWCAWLEHPLSEASAIVLDDGRILVAGGVDGSTGCSIDSTWFLDPATRRIERGPSLQVPSGVASATVIDQQGLILILGGEWVRPDDRGPANASRVYDARERRLWTTAPIPSDAARRMWYRARNGAIAALGGYRFIAPDSSAAERGDEPGFHVLSECFQLRINRVVIVPD